VVIPAYNEEGSIEKTVTSIYTKLHELSINHEIVVVNDNSKDGTLVVLEELGRRIPTLVYSTNTGPNGFGYAVQHGLETFSGDCVAIMMGDLSDDPEDLIKFYYELNKGYDCVFGSRWIKGGSVADYPFNKRIVNRLANWIIMVFFNLSYNDCTNAFKLYRRETIQGIKPFLSPHFNLTIELPLKAIVRGYSFTILPNSWKNRKTGESKLKIKEMGSRYFFIMLYCWIEKHFSKGDFNKK
jgi:dolichol-phosphate mannosyltransferase